jgi:CheY-like chemotaxis protein
MSTRRILVVEDGREYIDFFRLFLARDYEYLEARSGGTALERLAEARVDLVVMDMRFERCPAPDLLGDVAEVAASYFGGDLGRAARYVEDNQGALIVAELRRRGHDQPVLFVSDMPERRLANLKRLYGHVRAVPGFDAAAIRREIAAALDGEGA